MRIKENIKIKQIGDESILVSNEDGNMNYTRVISLNESAQFLIAESMDKDFSIEEWAEKLMGRYGINKAQAIADIQRLIEKLTEAGVLYE